MAYVIGSGNHAYGYLVQIGDYLFQSPVSYYSRRRVWDMAPGFEQDENTDSTRPVPPECLYCHAGQPRPVPRTLNRYQNPPFAEEAISCDRCHGDPAAHLRKPGRDTIINPARLAAKARASICEQCHLNGEIRVPNPNHEIGDFHPGQELEDVFTVYVRSAAQATTVSQSIKVISHAEQLALSTCSLRSASRCGADRVTIRMSSPRMRARTIAAAACRAMGNHWCGIIPKQQRPPQSRPQRKGWRIASAAICRSGRPAMAGTRRSPTIE